jgi:DNA-binding NarL/FixJ family response regulator
VRTLMARQVESVRMAPMQRVLIVDDHVPFRAAARDMLERGGFDVVGEAGESAGAVEATVRLRPDVILLDIHLPDDDGFITCERILDATGGYGGGAPAIVLTSSRPVGTFRKRLAQSRASGFIPKADLTAAGVAAFVGGLPG